MFHLKQNTNDNEDENVHQDQKVNELRAAIGPLSGWSLLYCNNACLRRYLEARNWNVDKSKKMLEETLKWRSTYKPEEIRWHEVGTEGETGKVYRANFRDRDGRSVIVMNPRKENSSSHDSQLRFLVYNLENAILNLPEDQEQMVWLMDLTGWSLSRAIPIKTARETVHILQCHYPERLSSAFIYNPPRIFEAFWKVVKYFLDPKTFQKVKFIYPKNKENKEVMQKHFDLNALPVEFGGTSQSHYDHEGYSSLMAKDDIKMESLWTVDEKHNHTSNGHLSTAIAQKSEANGLQTV